MTLTTEHQLSIGKLRHFHFQNGYYAYVGSAFGRGGLRARLGHHLKETVKPHWHIDYLRQVAWLEAIWLLSGELRREHDWATMLADLPDMSIPLPRFGASDCKCPTHLFFSTQPPSYEQFTERLRERFPGDNAIESYNISH